MSYHLAAIVWTVFSFQLEPPVVESIPTEYIVGLVGNVSDAVEEQFLERGCSLKDITEVVQTYQFHLYECSTEIEDSEVSLTAV